MHRTRINPFNRLIAAALLAAAAAADWIAAAFTGFGASITQRAAGLAIRIVRAIPAPHPKPGMVAKSPGDTSTAEQRMWLVPGKSYEATMHAKRNPAIEPGWRMCAST